MAVADYSTIEALFKRNAAMIPAERKFSRAPRATRRKHTIDAKFDIPDGVQKLVPGYKSVIVQYEYTPLIGGGVVGSITFYLVPDMTGVKKKESNRARMRLVPLGTVGERLYNSKEELADDAMGMVLSPDTLSKMIAFYVRNRGP